MKTSAELFEQAESLRRQAQDLLDKEQDGCLHPLHEVVEGSYKPSTLFMHAQPPFRVCKRCGYAEEGWYTGYWKLRGDTRMREDGVSHMARDDAWKFVRKFISNERVAALKFGRDE